MFDVRPHLRGRAPIAAAVAVVAVGAALGRAGAGSASIAFGVAVFVVVAPRGTLLTRVVAVAALMAAVLVAASLLGPVAPAVFGATALGGIICVPAAVACVLPRASSRWALPRIEADELAVAVVIVAAGWIFASPYIGASTAERLAAMNVGGADFAAHFDYMQNAWFHKGFLFVNTTHHVLEPRPYIAATPYGAHVVMAALGVLVSGHASLPAPATLFRLFVGFDVVSNVALVLVLTAMTARLLRFIGLGATTRALSVLVVGSVAVVGPLSVLRVQGFLSFTDGLALTLIALVFAVTARPSGWVADGAVVTAAIAVGLLTYTLMIPALLLAWAIFLMRTRAAWWTRSPRCLPVILYSTTIVLALGLS